MHLCPTKLLPQKAEDFDPNHLYISTPTVARSLPGIGLSAAAPSKVVQPTGQGLATPLLQMQPQQPYQTHLHQHLQQQDSAKRFAAAVRIHSGISVTPGWAAAVMMAYQTERPSMGLLDFAQLHASKSQPAPSPRKGRGSSPSQPQKRKLELKSRGTKRGAKKASLEPVLAHITQHAPRQMNMDLLLENISKLRREELAQALSGPRQARWKPERGWVVNL